MIYQSLKNMTEEEKLIHKKKPNPLEKANKKLHYIKGTKLEALTQKVSKNNKSTKIKGITYKYDKNYKKYVYQVSIQLARKRYYKTLFTLEDAINWRKYMEEQLYKSILEGVDK